MTEESTRTQLPPYLFYVVIEDGCIVYQTGDLGVAIGYRSGRQRGAIFSQVLPEFETVASPVLPKQKSA